MSIPSFIERGVWVALYVVSVLLMMFIIVSVWIIALYGRPS